MRIFTLTISEDNTIFAFLNPQLRLLVLTVFDYHCLADPICSDIDCVGPFVDALSAVSATTASCAWFTAYPAKRGSDQSSKNSASLEKHLTSTITNCKLWHCYEVFWVELCLEAREVCPMDEKPGDVLTIKELSAYLKIPKSTLYKLVREGKIPSQKIGRHWRFRKRAIDRWLEETRANKPDSGGDR